MPRRPQPRGNGQVPKGLKRPKAWHRQTDWIRFSKAMRLWPKEPISISRASDTPGRLFDPFIDEGMVGGNATRAIRRPRP
ncbi:MAG: hypothetical protein ACRDJ5_03650 [Actinomycetota bacterium]